MTGADESEASLSDEMRGAIEFMRALREQAPKDVSREESLRLVREGAEQLPLIYPTPDDVRVESVDIDGISADLLTSPGVADDRGLLYLHGGSYTSYSRRSHRELAARLGRAAGATVLVPDYRLAPEHPYPAAVDDALVCYRWLTQRGPVAVAGDSAGGGLALALCLRVGSAATTPPAALALLSPWTDLTLSGASIETVDDPSLDADRLRAAAIDYAGGRLRDPFVSPLFAELTGLPPVHIEVGTAEMLLDDSTRLADAITGSGGRAGVHVGQGLPHVYQILATTPEAVDSTNRIGVFLAEHLAPD